jgi:hypothetical protein
VEPPPLHGLRSERGVALVTALLVLFIVGVASATAIEYSTHTASTVGHERAHVDAVALAESGVAYAASILTNPLNDPANPATLPSATSPGSFTEDEGTAKYWGSYDDSSEIWTVYGQGIVGGPGAAAVHVASERFQVSSTGIGAWKYLYADAPPTCFSVANSDQIQDPLFVRGDLCLANSAQVTSSASPVYVSGTIQTANSASVGTLAAPVAELHVGGGCRYGGSGSFVTPCGSAQHVYATTQDTTVPSVPTKPTLELATWYANAKPGPSQPCTYGSFPSGFDNDSTLNNSLGDVSLMGSTAYNCSVVSGGVTIGRLTWTPGNPGTLNVAGTIYIDGNLTIAGATKGVYSGQATIYASGTVTFGNSSQLCGAYASGNCDWNNWDPATNMLVLVAGSTSAPDFTLGQSSQFQGGAYANTTYSQGNSALEQGPVVADNMSFANSAKALGSSVTSVPAGAPGGRSVTPIDGSWTG